MAGHAFVSYVSEDSPTVNRLVAAVRQSGVEVWLDRDSIRPGARWRNSIRSAIEQGAFFLACFSSHCAERSKSYMNEELVLAIDELRKYPADRAWFIPLKLSAHDIPDRTIGGGETLRDLQWLDLSADWDNGVSTLVGLLSGVRKPPPQSGNPVVMDTSRPFGERVGQLARAWEKSGRGADWLVNGKVFFALYCWFLTPLDRHRGAKRRSDLQDAVVAEYVAWCYAAIGGDAGWDAWLRERTLCSCHRESWSMENLRICTGCLRYRCVDHLGRCGSDCDGEIVG
ncbi:toll/interleukin-1 receptor domain-containing protein [Kitasatospora sp. NPDC088351]|uniref:toll/interleukin-1 receptor domain-containing protein n=1 Tax=Kitasatospora sp. NPDC088351 TaxID=3155180 RepID=UPI0034392947